MTPDECEDIEAWLLMAVGQFEYRWDKAWTRWRKAHNISDEDAGEMCFCPHDDDGVLFPEIEEWYEIYAAMKVAVEKEFGVEIVVDEDGCVFARHHLPDGDTITAP